MSDVVTKKKKKKSQAPVALVYFATLLLFLAVFGLIASFLVERLASEEEPDNEEVVTVVPAYNTLYARVNGKGVLLDLSVVRISPEKKQIVVTPASAYTVNAGDGLTFREVYEQGGIKLLEKAVEETFEIETDYYIAINYDTFESVADILGGIVYTPEEELYYLSKTSDANDISYQAGKAVSIDGHQMRLICQYPVFSEGWGGNVKFHGEALYQLVNGAFQQANITKNNLDNIYNIMTSNSDTNYSNNDFKQHKPYIMEMLGENLVPAVKVIPEGTWIEEKRFSVSDEFKRNLAEVYKSTEPDSSGEMSVDSQ